MRGIRRYVISLLLVVLVAAALAGTPFILNLSPRLGLDLRGGVLVILTAPDGTRSDVLDKTVDILRNRVDRAGVAEPDISREGATNIQIQLPGIEDRERLLLLIGQTAQLQFRQVLQEISSVDPAFEETEVSTSDDPAQEVVLAAEEGAKFRLSPAELTGESVRDATAVIDPNTGAWHAELRFDRAGSTAWAGLTGRLACLEGPQRRVAIVLDGQVESAPQVSEEVECQVGITGGSTVIEGSFTEREAKDLALVLTTGALPVELEQSQVVTVSPTLGRDALRAGLLAGALGLSLVMIYVLLYYRALGLQVWVSLLCFAAVIYGLIVVLGQVIGWSLTLAGVAGLIVSIGIATDSNIVFFERIKEEVHEGRTIRSSMDRGFSKAWRTLRAANAVTILAAAILYLIAVGPVRGFALALGMATTIDLAIFVTFTWPLAALLARSRLFSEGRLIGMRRAFEGSAVRRRSRMTKIYRSDFNIDFIGRRRIWLVVSGLVIVASLIALAPPVRGLNFGIDFRGGSIFRMIPDREVTVSEIRDVARELGFGDAVVQVLRDPTTGRSQVQIQTEAIDDPEERNRLADALTAFARAENIDVEAVGEKWGRQITAKALRGLVIFLVLVIIYMSWRLEPKMAVAAMAALIHDLLITAGAYAIIGFSVTPATVIALLTILGYSLYDTVVVFDKMKENTALTANARKSFAEIANQSMNQVLMRTVNTSLTTLLPVGSLLFIGSFLLGADTLRDLALALFVGIMAGAYSSLFVASPILSLWKERERRYVSVRERVLKERAPAEETEDEESEEEDQSEEEGRLPPERPSTVRVQQRKQSRKKRKRGRK